MNQRVKFPIAAFLAAIFLVTAADLRAEPPDLALSDPSFNGASWSAFDANKGQPAKLGLVLSYPFHPGVFISSADVFLKPSPAHAEIGCVTTALAPVPSAANLDDCFYQPAVNQIIIYYMGSFTPTQAVQYRVQNVADTDPGTTYDNFDTASVGNPVPVAGRDPARFVLVLDKSGSMDWSSHPIDPGCAAKTKPPGGSPCLPTRWQVLNSAVTAMLSVATPYALAGHDDFGAALFDSAVQVGNSQNIASLDSSNVASLQALLSAKTPGGGTSIGAGAVKFQTELTNGASTHNEFMLIFSDGDQNREPYLWTNDALQQVVLDPDDPAESAHPEFLPGGTVDDPDVDICPFSMRGDDPATPDATNRLQNIADWRCDGLTYTDVRIAGTPDLVQFFLQVLNEVLIGDKLELAAVMSGEIPRAPGASATETFTVSEKDLVFTILVTWPELRNGLTRLTLRKDGLEFPVIGGPPGSAPVGWIDRDRNRVTATLRRPFCVGTSCVQPGGDWELELVPFFEVGNAFPYNVHVTTDHPSIVSEFQVTQPTAAVGQPLSLTTRVTDGGAPLAGLADGSVTAEVCRPDTGLGNVLSASASKPGEGSSVDPISPAGLKVATMLDDAGQRAEILAALEATGCDTLTLAEGDPGVYGAQYTDTPVEGVYRVRFSVDADAPGSGRFTRKWTLTRYVPVVSDNAATLDSVTTSDITPCSQPGGCIAVNLKPVDAAGNLLGPGKGTLFSLVEFDGVLLQPVADNLDGSYTLQVGYPAGVTERPVLDIGGTVITLPIPGKGGFFQRFGHWLILLLILLALVLVAKVLKKKKA